MFYANIKYICVVTLCLTKTTFLLEAFAYKKVRRLLLVYVFPSGKPMLLKSLQKS